jgi:hypothetical protein
LNLRWYGVELKQPGGLSRSGIRRARDIGRDNGIVDFGRHRVRVRFRGRRDRTGIAAALPESYTTGGPKEMTGAVVGLMTLLLALVLGLLIWTAYGVFSTQKASVQTLAITDLKLDEAFQDYGPEAAEGHRILRDGIKNTIAEIWNNSDDEQAVIHKFGYARANLKARLALLNTLQPASDQQTAAKTEATQAAIAIDHSRR